MLHLPNGPGPQTTHSSNTCRVLNEPSQWTTTMENVSLYILRTKHCIIVQKFTPSISLSLAPENIIYSEKKNWNKKWAIGHLPLTAWDEIYSIKEKILRKKKCMFSTTSITDNLLLNERRPLQLRNLYLHAISPWWRFLKS